MPPLLAAVWAPCRRRRQGAAVVLKGAGWGAALLIAPLQGDPDVRVSLRARRQSRLADWGSSQAGRTGRPAG